MDTSTFLQSLNPEQHAALIAFLKQFGLAVPSVQPPPPVQVLKTVKFFGKSGRELQDGETITFDEAHDGKTIVYGPPNAMIGTQTWQNDWPWNGVDPNNITNSYTMGANGTLTLGGVGLSGGPTSHQDKATVRVKFFAGVDSVTGEAYDYKKGGFMKWDLLREFTVTIRHTDSLDWERKDGENTYNPYLDPFLTAVFSAARLKISESDWTALNYAAFHGTQIPPDVAARNADFQKSVLGIGFGTPQT